MDPAMRISWTNAEKLVYSSMETAFDDYNGYGDINIIKAYEMIIPERRRNLVQKESVNSILTTDAELKEKNRKHQ